MKQQTKQKFKQTEIGIIPEDWEIKSVNEVADAFLGGTPKTTKKEYWNGNIKWVSARDVSNCKSRYISKTEKTITQKGIDNSAAKILPRDTIVITSRGTVGELVLLSEPMSFNQTCYGLKAKQNTYPLFLYYKLKSQIANLKSVSYGTIFSTITMRTFDELKMSFPNLLEQKSIAKILSNLDSKIELNQQMNKTLEAIGQALFKHWFVDFEFPNEEGKPYKSSGGEMVYAEEVGKEIPKGWRTGKLGEIIINFDSKRIPLSSREREKRRGIYPYYGATSIMDYVDDYLFDGIYVLMAEDGSVIDDRGYPILQYVWGKFWVNNHTHILQGKNGITPEFLYLLLKQTNVEHTVTGAVQPKINQENMNRLQIVIPSNETMFKFSNIISHLFKKYRLSSDEIKTLSQVRDTLLPKLTSGKIRVTLNAVENQKCTGGKYLEN